MDRGTGTECNSDFSADEYCVIMYFLTVDYIRYICKPVLTCNQPKFIIIIYIIVHFHDFYNRNRKLEYNITYETVDY